MEDMQVGLLAARMFLVERTAYFEPNADPVLGESAWYQADSLAF